LVVPIEAQEWTRFRGPNGTGISDTTSIPVEWTEADYLWRIKLPGVGNSSPVIWGDRIFLLSGDPETALRYVVCVDAKTGNMIWRKDYESSTHHLNRRNTYASSTPVVDQQQLYIAWAAPEQLTFRALDHDGNQVWKKELGPWNSQHGFGTSPIVYEDLVILFNSQQADRLEPGQEPGQSLMMAFDKKTGELRWSTPRTTTRVCYTTPCIYQPADGPAELVGYNTGDGIFSLDPKTGMPNWSISVFRMRTVSSPIFVGDLVFGSNGSGGGGNYLVAVRAGDEPEEVYQITRQASYVPTPIAREDLVFVFSDRGMVSCYDVSTGEQVWLERLSSGFSGSPVLIDGRIYCMDEEGDVLVLAAEREFKELARNPLGERSRATPAVSGGRMFLRTDTQLFCIGNGQVQGNSLKQNDSADGQ
jgi:outer membrane protein assembly factor BamB